MQLRLPRALSLTALLGLATTVVSPARSAQHLRLTKSEPAADTTLSTPPRVIRLWYSEDPDLALFSTTVTRQGGAAVGLSKARWESGAEGAPIVLDVTGAVPPGKYTVAWKAMSDDGHAVKGEFGFTVTAPIGSAGN